MKKTLALVLLLLPAWMSGRWTATVGNVQMEEYWSAPGGGMMLGLHRDIGAKKTSFEFMRIEARGEQLVFVAQPSGRPPTEFPAKSVGKSRIVFENPAHDFPKRVIYWRSGEKLCARVEGDGGGGEEWCWDAGG
jgi:hypothetical protein